MAASRFAVYRLNKNQNPENHMHLIDRFFEFIRSRPIGYRFTIFIRCLLATAFIPTGMVKLLGHRFTAISVDSPIGSFFEAMYQTGVYWNFLGFCQVAAGVLLLFPRVAHLGALIFLPIIVNIFVITVSMRFGGTPFVTGLMLLAVAFICLWDFHRWRGIITMRPLEISITDHKLDKWEKLGFVLWACSIIVFFSLLRFSYLMGSKPAAYAIVVGILAGIFTLLRFVWCWRTQRLETFPLIIPMK